MDFFDTIYKRVSIRSYKSDAVEKEKLDKILEAARIAPTAVNYQPFKIFVISTRGREEELKKICNRGWFIEPPYVICVCILPDKAWVRKDGRKYGDVDTAIILDHMTLAAAALGLGTCWIGNFNIQAAREFLNIGSDMEPFLFTPLGYASKENIHPDRKPIKDLVQYI